MLKSLNKNLIVIAIAVCAVLAFAPATAEAQATVIKQNFSFDASGIYGHACGIELVDCTGSTLINTTLVINNNRLNFSHHANDQGLSCVGLDTGLVYRSTYAANGTDNYSSPAATCAEGCTFPHSAHWDLQAPGPNNDMRIRVRSQFTVNANGDVTASNGTFVVECG